MIRIVVADDHNLVREGIKQVIELEKDMKVVGQATNGEEAVRIVCELEPDIVLMDINMPVLNGIQALQQLNEKNTKSKIIMLTIHSDKEYLMTTVKHGAAGYILKDADTNILIDAIRKVYQGGTFIPSDLASELIRGYEPEIHKSQDDELTGRELEVLKLISQGMSNKEIGSALYISEKTVKNHISNIFRKLNLNDRTQAAIYAIKHGIK